MGFLSSIFGQGDDVSQTDQRTQSQLEMAKLLQQMATTGSGAGITLGTPYSGSMGNYDLSGLEQSGLSQLFGQTGTNQALSGAQDVFTKMSQSSFDPSVLDPYMKAAQRSATEGGDILDRDAAVMGNRFGTAILGEKANLSENIQSNIQQKLAELFLNQQNVSMQGAQGLANVGGQQANMQQQNLQNMFQYGQLERQLKNQEAQANFNEWSRQRNETLGRIDLMSQEANRNPYMGISSIPGSSSPFSSLISSVLGGFGADLGENILPMLGGLFAGPAGAAAGSAVAGSAVGGLFSGGSMSSSGDELMNMWGGK